MFTNESEASTESEAYDSASVVPIHTRLELSSDSDSAYDSASVASVASVNQPFKPALLGSHLNTLLWLAKWFYPELKFVIFLHVKNAIRKAD